MIPGMIRWALLGLLLSRLGAGEGPAVPSSVLLRSPLSTMVELPQPVPGSRHLSATLVVPHNAPRDLGIGAYVQDRDGTWYQRASAGVLEPGRHVIDFDLSPGAPLLAWEVGKPAQPVALDEVFGGLAELVAERNPDFYEALDGSLSRASA